MSRDEAVDSVDEEIAQAVGVLLLADVRIQEAASAAGVTQWELEEAIKDAGLTDLIDIDEQRDASETIDDLFEN